MIKLISIILFFLIDFGLTQLKKRKFPEYDQLKLSIIQRSLIGLFMGLMFGVAGAIKIAYYPEFDKNFDVFVIGWLVFALIFDEVIEYYALSGKRRQLRTNKGKV